MITHALRLPAEDVITVTLRSSERAVTKAAHTLMTKTAWVRERPALLAREMPHR
jgi:hypothetical protein